MGIVFDMLSGNRFPFLVESTIRQPPLCPTNEIDRKHAFEIK